MVKLFKLDKYSLTFLAILFLGAILRFYKLPQMAAFDFDQEYAANFAWSVLHLHQKLLIGQGLSIQGLFMGPWYFYYLTPFFALTNLYPLGAYIGSILLGLLNISAFYLVGSRLFSKTAGLISAYLAAVLFPLTNNDWAMVPVYSLGGIVLLTWLLFYLYWNGDSKKSLIILGLVFGFFTSMHPILFPFYFVFAVLLMIKRRLPSLKTTLFSLFAFILPNLPLLLFEYWHNFLEVRELTGLFKGSVSPEPKNFAIFSHYIQTVFSIPADLLSITILPKVIIPILFFLTVLILIFKKIGFWKESFHRVTFPITIAVFIIYYCLYPAHVPEYYFIALSILILLYLGGILALLTNTKKYLPVLGVILVSITIFNLKLFYERWTYPSLTNLDNKDFIVKEILKRQPQNQDFFVSYISAPGWNFGFNYLFKAYGRKPQTIEARPPVYTIVVPKSLSPDSINVSSGNIGLILPK